MPLLTKLKYKEYKKNYNAINKVMLNEKAREYYNNNSEEIKWKINVKVSCECGEEISKSNLLRHQRTKKHQEALNNLNNINNVSLQTDDIREDGKQKPDKKFKQNSYEEIRKLVEDSEGNDIVKEVKNKKKNSNEKSYNFKLFD